MAPLASRLPPTPTPAPPGSRAHTWPSTSTQRRTHSHPPAQADAPLRQQPFAARPYWLLPQKGLPHATVAQGTPSTTPAPAPPPQKNGVPPQLPALQPHPHPHPPRNPSALSPRGMAFCHVSTGSPRTSFSVVPAAAAAGGTAGSGVPPLLLAAPASPAPRQVMLDAERVRCCPGGSGVRLLGSVQKA